jgi:hypothetical protein
LLIIAAIKRRRMRRRRSAARADLAAAGAWDEMLDRLSELGYDIPQRVTRTQTASRMADGMPDEASLGGLALLTDDAVFSGRDIERDAAEAVWTQSLGTVSTVREAVTPVRRLLARYRVSAGRRWASRVAAAAVAQSDALFRTKK